MALNAMEMQPVARQESLYIWEEYPPEVIMALDAMETQGEETGVQSRENEGDTENDNKRRGGDNKMEYEPENDLDSSRTHTSARTELVPFETVGAPSKYLVVALLIIPF